MKHISANRTKQILKFECSQVFVIAILVLQSFYLKAQTDKIETSYTCGDSINIKGNINKSSFQQGVLVDNATETNMYLEEVYGKKFTAVIKNLPKGKYTLEIYMAEQYHKTAGARIFNIYYNDTLIKENLDIYSEVGVRSEYKFNYPISHSPSHDNKEISIRFETITDNAKFNAIRILNKKHKIVASVMASEILIKAPPKVEGIGNHFIKHMFTADPSAHVFENKMFVYPSHDKDDADWFNMRDYHVFSSEDLSTWQDHGVALDIDNISWAKEYMWAPDCAYKNGWYYLYFPVRDTSGLFKIGVATSQSPSGPFIPEEKPMKGSFSVDPSVFIDEDGQTYMYFGGDGHGGQTTPWVAKLDNSMKEFSNPPIPLNGVDYWFEASWMNKINNTYYLSYSTGMNHLDYPNASVIAYATASDPMGPFTYKGVIAGYVTSWTNHHSIVEYKGQWYFFYHNANLSGGIGEKRSIGAEYLHFNDDGSIRQVIQTKRGIGSYDGLARIEAENYSETENVVKKECSEGGFQVSFDSGDSLVFNNIDFGENEIHTIDVRIASTSNEGTIEIYAKTGELLGAVKVSNTGGSENWQTFSGKLKSLHGIKDICLKYIGTDAKPMHLNWINFTD